MSTETSTEIETAPGFPLTITSKAVKMVKMTRETEDLDVASGLRVAVRGGGCSGFEYALDFELEPRNTDWVHDFEGLQVFVDPVSANVVPDQAIVDSSPLQGKTL